MRALNSVGAGPAATKDETPSGKAGAPKNLTATGGNGIITLSWEVPDDSGGSAIVSYEIQKYDTTTTNWRGLGSVTELFHVDRNVTVGATENYRVRALNANANEPSDWATASGLGQGKQVPGVPQDLEATSGIGQITYSWKAPESDGGADILRYEYKIYLEPTNIPTTWENSGTATSVTKTGLSTGATDTYDFLVRAVNSVGAGEATLVLADKYATRAPGLPSHLRVTALTSDSILLTWTSPTVTGGSPINGYEIQFHTGDEEWGDGDDNSDADFLVPDPVLATTYTHRVLMAGTKYYYRVRARNVRSPMMPTTVGADDLRGWTTVDVSATTISTAPGVFGAEEGFIAELVSRRIKLSWDPPPANGSPIIEYKIRWNDDSSNDYPPSNVFAVAGTATEFTFQAPDPGTYRFQILAANSVGVPMNTEAPPVPDYGPATAATATIEAVASPAALADPVIVDGVATFTWNPTADNNHDVVRYDLQYVTTEDSANPDAEGWEADEVVNVQKTEQPIMLHTTDALPGGMYLHFRLRMVTSIGYLSGYTSPDNLQVPERAPDNPVLEYVAIGPNVILSWDQPLLNGGEFGQVGGAPVAYQLQFKKDDGDWGDGADAPAGDSEPDEDDVVTYDHVDTRSFTHENLAGDATYSYRVRTVSTQNANLTGADKTWSDVVKVETDPGAAETPVMPSTPVLIVTANDDDNDEILISWQEAEDGSSPVTGYQLMRWNGSDWEDIPANLGAEDTEYTDTDVEFAKMYFYAIRALSDDGPGEWTQQGFQGDALDAEAPDMPVVTASVVGQVITLSWMPPANNGLAITGYFVQSTALGPFTDLNAERTVDQRQWINLDPVSPNPATATTYTHSGVTVTPGETRYYQVRADNDANPGTGEYSDEVEATADAVAPTAAPTNPDATGGTRQVTLTWIVVPENSNGGAEITSQELQKWNADSRQWKPLKDDLAADAEMYLDKGLEPGTLYYYRIRAVNVMGGGEWAVFPADQPARTITAAPSAPFMTAMAVDQDITLSWTAPDDNGQPITGYQLQRLPSVTGNSWGSNVEGGNAFIVPEPAGTITYTDKDLEPGVTYYYQIRAMAGAAGGAYSAIVDATAEAKVPGRIADDDNEENGDQGLVLEGEDGKVTLKWTAPETNGSDISRYEIVRWYPDSGMWEDVRNDLPASLRMYVESGLEVGATYFYRIRAVNSVGAGPWSTFGSVTAETPEDE